MRKSKKEKEMEKAVDVACQRHANGASIPIMELGRIHKAGMDAAMKGENIDDAVKAAIAPYRIK